MDHGNRRTYSHGCRCADCTHANTLYTKRLRMDHNAGIRRRTDNTGTRRRLLALGCMGWSYAALGEELRVAKRVVAWLLRGPGLVELATEAKVREMYDRLAMKPGPGNPRVMASARRNGGFPPLAWDDETIDDPAASPCLGARESRSFVEDIEWLIGTDTPERIAARVGYPRMESLTRRLERNGRHDLARIFDQARSMARAS